MKNGMIRLAIGMLLAGALAAAAEEKIGVMNGQEVLKQYHKTKAASDALDKLSSELRDAQKRMVDKLQEMDDACKKAIAEANDKALSEEARARKRTAAEDKLAELKEYELQVRKSDLDNRKKMDEQNTLMIKPIVQEVSQAVTDTAKEMGLTLVLDTSETGPRAVWYAAERLDITEAVIKRLNKNVPAPATPAATEGAPATPAAK